MIVGVLPNLDKRGVADILERMKSILESNGIKPYLPDYISFLGYESIPEEELFERADIVITVGGDGTIMRYAKTAAKYNKPVLGINAGRLGFLANIEANQLGLLANLKNGKYSTESRMMIKVKAVENGVEQASFFAVNDAVISSGFMSRLIDIQAYIDDEPICYRADGLIVSTPTGSTAYSLSAGGPIIDPAINNLIITPICSHSLSAKPIILSGDITLKLKAFSMKKSDVYLLIDGRRSYTIKPFTEIYVSKADSPITLIKLAKRSFYKTLSEKFK
ncbi:MAG: NAD(+)/NADH kinase [Acutalibacteraceae bacterium]|nr:NAD(+)/NADH kinase [Acutalibacteraceae bacterium]